MQFLNPRTDLAFKKIFGSAKSKDILLSFLNAILGLSPEYQLIEITILDPYLAPKIAGMKDSYLDVRAEDQSGKSYIIEMQVLNVESFEKRILYNACKTYANQLNSAEGYHLLTDVIAVTITNFVLFPEKDAIVSQFKLRGDDGEVYSDDLELVFAELPKFVKTEDQLQSIIDKWLFFLKHADDLSVIPQSLADEPAIVQAFDIANRASWTKRELEDQERNEIAIQDQRGAISLAEKRAAAAAATLAAAQAKTNTTAAIAVNLLHSGLLSDEQVSQMTELSLEQVAALRLTLTNDQAAH